MDLSEPSGHGTARQVRGSKSRVKSAHCSPLPAPFVHETRQRQPDFGAGKWRARLFFKVDGHPNAVGYRLMADLILDHLRSHPDRYQLADLK